MPSGWVEEETIVLKRGEAARPATVVICCGLWRTGHTISSFDGTALSVPKCVVERGEKLEPALNTRVVIPERYRRSRAVCDPKRYERSCPQRKPQSRLKTQTVLADSKSSGVQGFSQSRVARLMLVMGHTVLSGCSCSRAAPELSMQGSQNTKKGRESPAATTQPSSSAALSRFVCSFSRSLARSSIAPSLDIVTP